MWGGRFNASPSQIMNKINVSVDFDQLLYDQDIRGSKAHAAMLLKVGIINQPDHDQIQGGLDQIQDEIRKGHFEFKDEFEDIHMNIEARLKALIGAPAGRLHTARSRNDQVVTDVKLWLRDRMDHQLDLVKKLQLSLIDQAEKTLDYVMPGYTHMQVAQPVSFAHHLMAYVQMLARDHGRLEDARARLNECPLGAAALAGTSFPIDRHMTAHLLGFDRPTENSMDSVASRDFILEYLAAASILATHLSRFAEEIVFWMNTQFQFIELPDHLTTGSSIMPQKRNPDAAELVRAKPGRILGAFTGLLMVLKGLPLTYGKDMQEDKEPLFDAADSLDLVLNAMIAMIDEMKPNKERLEAALEGGFSTATDLADWLVGSLKLPFRDAHHITGALVKLAESKGLDLSQLSLAEMQAVEPRITESVFDILSPLASLQSRTSHGGASPAAVMAAIERAKAKITA
ncbi:MAG: argininosuccinate lyase [Alphaproteobacteria bacterium]